MKRYYIDRVKERAQRYSSLSLYMQRMDQLGVFSALFESLFQFVKTEKERDSQLQKSSKNFFTRPDKIGSESEVVSFISSEELLMENLKLILQLLVEDIFRNFHSYIKDKALANSQISASSVQSQNKLLESKNKLKEDLSKQLLMSKFESNFIEPPNLESDNQIHGGTQQPLLNLTNRSANKAPIEKCSYNDAIDDSDSDQSEMMKSSSGLVEIEEKDCSPMELGTQKAAGQPQHLVFNYQTNNPAIQDQKATNEEELKNRRYTEQHQTQRLEKDYILSQYQTPQYKQSEIENPISSPHTDERDIQLLNQLQQRQEAMARLQMNLLSQENSAKQETAFQSRVAQEEEKKGEMEERMRQNLMAFEKNKLFAAMQGSSIEDKLVPQSQPYEENKFKEQINRYKRESGLYIDDGDDDEDGSEEQFVTSDQVFNDHGGSPQQEFPTLEDTLSDGNPQLTQSMEAAQNLQRYETKEGVSLKMNKLNLNQLQTQNKLASSNPNEDASSLLLMDPYYVKNLPKTNRDMPNPPPLHPGTKASHPTDSQSLQFSSEQPTTKISAEEAVRSYLNANFILQKQPKDRLDLLCQSRELNPLVSLSIENQGEQQPQGKGVVHNHIQSQLLRYEGEKQAVAEGANTDRSRSKTPLTARMAQVNNLQNQIESNSSYTNPAPKESSLIEKIPKDPNMTAKTLTSGSSQPSSSIVNADGKYLNQLAKVIKNKGQTPQSSQSRQKSRNQAKGASNTTPLPLHQPPFNINVRIQPNPNLQPNASLIQHQEGKDSEQSNNKVYANLSKAQIQFKGQTKYQQFTLSQRNESQHSQGSTNSAAGPQKVNKFSMRRFTNEASSPQNDSALQSKMAATINQSNIIQGIGSSNSNKTLNLTSHLPPHQKSVAQLVAIHSQAKKPLLTNSPQDQNLQKADDYGSNQSHQKPLKEANSQKNIVQYASAAQAVIYGQLKKQKKRHE